MSACSSEDKRHEPPKLCQVTTFCDVSAPPPEELQISHKVTGASADLRSASLKDFGELRSLSQVGPSGNGWTDRKGQKHRSLRIFFVHNSPKAAIGSIWVVFDHIVGERPKTQILVRGVDRGEISVVIDGRRDDEPFQPYRIAVIDRATRVGPTFVSGYGQQPYVRNEYDSVYVRSDWERLVTSSCGGGPLTDVPRTWVIERNRLCGFGN
jgi:hypothetical protein